MCINNTEKGWDSVAFLVRRAEVGGCVCVRFCIKVVVYGVELSNSHNVNSRLPENHPLDSKMSSSTIEDYQRSQSQNPHPGDQPK